MQNPRSWAGVGELLPPKVPPVTNQPFLLPSTIFFKEFVPVSMSYSVGEEVALSELLVHVGLAAVTVETPSG